MRWLGLVALLLTLSRAAVFAEEKGRGESASNPLGERLLPTDVPEARLLGEAGAWLLEQQRDDPAPRKPGGVRGAWWPEFDAHPFTTDSLYGGVAGTVLALMTLAEMTGEARYADAARRGVRHLIDAAVPTPGGLAWDVAWDDAQENVHHTRYPGLYTGAAGIAWVLLTYGDAFEDPEARSAGIRGLDAVIAAGRPGEGASAGMTWEDGGLDVIGGAAGIVTVLLDAWRMTGEERFRTAAVAGAHGLLAAAVRAADGWSWPSALGGDRVYSGFSHGVAGIGATLARTFAATGDERFLHGAREAARWLERTEMCVADATGTAWRHDTKEKPGAPPREGWCHGPAGTCRLHLLLHSLTGEPRYLETAEAGARWLLAHTDPTKDRAESGFWAPSLCCGAAGVGVFLVDLARYTGNAAYLSRAEGIVGFLDRVADRPVPGRACWSLSGRPEGAGGKTFHGTCLMIGQGGYVTFLARLAQERRRVVREVFVPPDGAAAGQAPGRREVIVELGAGSERFRRSARRLASYRGAERERLADATDPDALRDLLRRARADAAALVVAPEAMDVNLNRRAIDAACRVDDDVFPDVALGWLTASDPAHVRAMLDRMAGVEADGLAPRGTGFGIVSGGFDKPTVLPAAPPEDGIAWTHAYFPLVETDPEVRVAVGKTLEAVEGAGLVEFGGNGDAMRVWLFSDRRNTERAKWWPYEPSRVLRDLAHREMPGIGAPDLAAWDLAGKVVWFSTCHSGEPTRTAVWGDVVSTFGDTGGRVRFHELGPGESLCTAILARAPAAFLAPVGPNHGWLALVERRRAVRERLSLGEAIRRGQVEVALSDRAFGGIPLVEQHEGRPEAVPPFEGAVMRENVLNRVLYGDPLFRPFASLPPNPALWSVGRTDAAPSQAAFDVRLRIELVDALEWWDSFRPPERGEHVVASVPLADGEEVLSVEALGEPALTFGEWAVERRRAAPPLLWLGLNAALSANRYDHRLWVRGKEIVLRVTRAAAGKGAPGGEVLRGK